MLLAGAYYKGQFPQRSNDTIGFSTSLINVNPGITDRNNSVLAKTKGSQASGAKIAYEVNYGVAIAPGITFKPFLRFITHPDQATVAKPSGNNTHALFIGVLLDIDVASVMGLPTPPH
jgi:carbohydrate-selective porin OprB